MSLQEGIRNQRPEDSWMDYIREELLQRTQGVDDISQQAKAAWICRVPRRMRDCSPAAYTPQFMSFGPYHATFEPCEQNKRKIDTVSKHNVESIVNQIRSGDLQHIVKQYHGELKVGQEALPYLLAIDGVYMLQILCSVRLREWGAVNLSVVEWHSVLYDLALLENQIPLQLLEHALALIDATISRGENLDSLVRNLLIYVSPFNDYALQRPLVLKERKHLLDCLHYALTLRLDNSQSRYSFTDEETVLPSASYLSRCGIKFVASKTNLTGIRFDKSSAALFLPKLWLHDNLELFLRNLVAYELSTLQTNSHELVVLRYMTFMDALINTEEDVEVLVRSNVLINVMGSNKEAAEMWNGLCKHIPYVTHPAVEGILFHCKKRRHRRIAELKETYFDKSPWLLMSLVVGFFLLINSFRWIAELKETYFDKSPWLLVSLVVGFVVLINSIIQTIYTVKGFYSKGGP